MPNPTNETSRRAVTGTGTYSRAGRIETGARPAVSGVDVRS